MDFPLQTILFSRPLTAPAHLKLPGSFRHAGSEADLSYALGRRYPWLGRWTEHLCRLTMAARLAGGRGGARCVVSGRYGEYFAILQGIVRAGARPHLLLDIEWLAAEGAEARGLAWHMRRRAVEGATRIQVFCHAEARNYAAYFGVDESKFVWIPYCTDPVEAEAERADFILSSGVAQRDYRCLFEAVRPLGVRLLVVAPPSHFEREKIPSNVEVVGSRSRADYAQLLAASRLVVLGLQPRCLRYPGVITYVTAMHAGKCVIVNEPAGAASYIEDGKTGFLVPPSDPEALRGRIVELLGDPEKADRVGAAARQHAAREFSSARYLRDIEALLATMA